MLRQFASQLPELEIVLYFHNMKFFISLPYLSSRLIMVGIQPCLVFIFLKANYSNCNFLPWSLCLVISWHNRIRGMGRYGNIENVTKYFHSDFISGRNICKDMLMLTQFVWDIILFMIYHELLFQNMMQHFCSWISVVGLKLFYAKSHVWEIQNLLWEKKYYEKIINAFKSIEDFQPKSWSTSFQCTKLHSISIHPST